MDRPTKGINKPISLALNEHLPNFCFIGFDDIGFGFLFCTWKMALYFCRMAPQKNAAEIEDTPLAFRTPLNCSCFKSGKFTVLLKSGISMNPTDTCISA